MSPIFSFDILMTYSSIVDQNDFFIHFHNPNALFRYDSNFFQLLFSPTSEEFQLIEEMQYYFSLDNNLEHVQFFWPENQGIHPDTLAYLAEQNYGLEKRELCLISPNDFPFRTIPDVKIVKVTVDLLEPLKEINYTEDLTISEDYAQDKSPFYDSLFHNSTVEFYMAYYKGEPAGSLILCEGEESYEIDDMFTVKKYRRKGVAQALQQVVMTRAKDENKYVVLAADVEDSPIEMYKKQGYTAVSSRIGVQKRMEAFQE